MTVIAMTCEAGTGGRRIAAGIAQRLSLDLADRDFLEQRVADRSMSRRMLPDRQNCRCWSRPALAMPQSCLARHAADEIRELAAYGDVVLQGWGAPWVVQAMPHVLRVRVLASPGYRLRSLAPRYPTLAKSALEDLIRRTDACLAHNLEPVIGPQWRDLPSYDLVIAAHRVGIGEAIELIERLVRTRAPGYGGPGAGVPACCRARASGYRRVTRRPACDDVPDRATLSRAEQLLFERACSPGSG